MHFVYATEWRKAQVKLHRDTESQKMLSFRQLGRPSICRATHMRGMVEL